MEVNAIHEIIDLSIYKAEMENSGLVISELFGDFDRSQYAADSPNLIILASQQLY